MAETPYAPRDFEGMKSRLESVRATPLPATFQERLDLLERHLRDNLPAGGETPVPTDPGELAETIRFIRELAVENVGPAPGTRDLSECDQAALEGVAAITLGCVIGEAAGLLAFGWGVYHLTQHCHEA